MSPSRHNASGCLRALLLLGLLGSAAPALASTFDGTRRFAVVIGTTGLVARTAWTRRGTGGVRD